jgi:hypothetical protein
MQCWSLESGPSRTLASNSRSSYTTRWRTEWLIGTHSTLSAECQRRAPALGPARPGVGGRARRFCGLSDSRGCGDPRLGTTAASSLPASSSSIRARRCCAQTRIAGEAQATEVGRFESSCSSSGTAGSVRMVGEVASSRVRRCLIRDSGGGARGAGTATCTNEFNRSRSCRSTLASRTSAMRDGIATQSPQRPVPRRDLSHGGWQALWNSCVYQLKSAIMAA